MAPADNLSPPGTSSYSSDTLNVGDGTWDFTKNTFLLPNLVGLNFETMQYNGMGNRFATLTEYHSLILGHGVLAAITFLFIVPIAVLLARYYTRQPGSAVRYHAYMQVLAVGFTTVVFILGFFAVGPPRALTNPHHGIGVAIYVLILLQAIGGRFVRHLSGRGRSFRLHVHRWFGRCIALLGIIQIPLGLTLYGSPKALFVLYALWMAFLLFLYFILDYRDHGRREWNRGDGYGDESSRVERKSGGALRWLGPLAAGAGAFALLRGRKKNRDAERAMSRTPSPVDRRREPTVISSRRESDSFYDEKQPDRRRASGGGGFMNKVLAAGAGIGAGALVSKMMGRRDKRHDDEYSAVATDTPSRVRRNPPRSEFTESEYTERTEDPRRRPSRHEEQSSVLPAPRPPRPMTPRRSHPGTSRFDSTVDGSDYSSYVSPSRRTPERRKSGGGVGKGLLAGMGLGFLANRLSKDRRDRKEEERLRDEEDRRRDEKEDRRAGRRVSKYTGDGYPSPGRRESRRRPHRPVAAPSGITATTEPSILSGDSSIEPRGNTPYDPAPPLGARPPVPAAIPAPAAPGAPPVPIPYPVPLPTGATSRQHSRYDVTEPASMPPMPSDPHGIFHRDSDGSEMYSSPTTHRRRRQDGNAAAAAAAAAASASALAFSEQEEERRRRGGGGGGGGGGGAGPEQHTPQQGTPVSVHVAYDPGRNITLRKLTDDEARREQQRRRRADSVSSVSGGEGTVTTGPGSPAAGPSGGSGGGRRYRRDSSSMRRAETAAEHRVEGGGGMAGPARRSAESLDNEPLAPLSPPNPAFARRPGGGAGTGGKDSAYYSGPGQPGGGGGPSGAVPAAGTTVSSLGMSSPAGLMSPGGSHATFTSGPLNDAAAADRRRRRRLERRDGSRQATTVDFS